jgi:hypothetical protein
MGPKAPNAFNKIKKQHKWEKLEKKIEQGRRWVKKMENLLSSLRREKIKMRKRSWTRHGEVILIEIFMYLGEALFFSLDETTAYFTYFGILVVLERMKVKWKKFLAHFLRQHFSGHRSGCRNKQGNAWCKSRSIMLRHEAQDEGSYRKSVSCESLGTLRRFETRQRYSVYTALNIDSHCIINRNVIFYHVSNRQNVVILM